MKTLSPLAIFVPALLVAIVAVHLVSAQAKKSPSASSRVAILQGKVVDSRTGAPLPGCAIVAGGQTKDRDVFEGGAAHETDKEGKFRIEVEPGKYFLNLAETRAMTLPIARGEEAKGRLTPQRTQWREITGGATQFRQGSGVAVDARKGQIRTFMFRFKPLD